MIINTTIHLDRSIKHKIDSVSQKFTVSRSAIVVMLLKRLIRYDHLLTPQCRSVKYQGVLPKSHWQRLHVCIDYRDYEMCIDMRKFSKMSVSYLIAYSASLYLDRITEDMENGEITDNCQPLCYNLSKRTVEGAIIWKICWGMPVNLDLIFTT